MKTTGYKMLVKPEAAKEQVTKSGIIMATADEIKSNKGHVVVTGPDVKTTIVGDKVQYNPFTALEIEVEYEKFVLITENDIQVIF